MSAVEPDVPGVDPTVPSVARMYDYYLGGKDHFPSDREAAEKIIAIVPEVRETARDNRAFIGKAVRLMAEQGVRQFLDIGAGLPTQENVHQVAQRIVPDARVVYVDNDPIVLSHARALLADNPHTVAVWGDVTDPAALLRDPEVAAHLDFGRPVGLLMSAVLHFVPGDQQTSDIVKTLRAPLVPGSHLLISHFYTPDTDDPKVKAGQQVYRATRPGALIARSLRQIAAYFDGLSLLEPGLVPVKSWRPDSELDREIAVDLAVPGLVGAVGRLA
ncbi:SAM-dependent methyltransferase [Nonomuraea thailandensis]|uniref:SAM-dependent methyltransferase n=1 Tax=Nonomuraea thailandensis TaxID=1188745 RepID=A0A9X2K483_9ACTN|nr:SAM-dependent methyltransferase [Nonomuraea thailandensis]MCP2360232.1 SAM-dependent methyltransferase [Nonomuraea thailandensis]